LQKGSSFGWSFYVSPASAYQFSAECPNLEA
jgi:hypothetical protein